MNRLTIELTNADAENLRTIAKHKGMTVREVAEAMVRGGLISLSQQAMHFSTTQAQCAAMNNINLRLKTAQGTDTTYAYFQ